MAFVHPQSCECVKSELDLFAVPPTQTSVETGTWVEYNPVSALAHGLPIEFNILGTGQDYIDMANSMLMVSAKITKADGTDIDDTNAVGPINLTMHSLFAEIDMKLNDTMITTTNNTYAYRAYLETLLSYGVDSKQSQLQCAMYYKDTANQMNDGDPIAAVPANKGLKSRQTLFAASRTVDMLGKIHGDLMFSDRYLPSDCSLRFRLVRNKDAFCLMSSEGAAGYKLQIVSCKMYVRKVKISPSVFVAHAQALQHGNMKYPIRRVVVKTFTVTSGLLNFTQENIFTGQLPTRVVIGFVSNHAFNGSYGQNPFNFQHFNLSQLKLYVDGQQGHVAPIEPDYANGRYISAYLSLFAGTDKLFRDEGLDVTREDYPNGYALYAFDLSPDLGEQDHFSLAREGNLRIDAKFAVALPNTINAIVYAEFDNVIEVDRNKNIIYDFSN